jgi:hypothetical protein
MPELIYPPTEQVWPPPAAIASTVTKHVVGFKPPRPGRSEKHGPVESFQDICDQHDISFAALIEFNFGLVEGEPHYFEKINWFLKKKLGCTKTTEKGNFVFSGGETIYIPPGTIEFTDVPPLIVARPKIGEIRWVKFASAQSESGEASYMIPGVDRTSEAPSSNLPGGAAARANKAEGIAALVQFLSTTGANRLGSMATKTRLDARLATPVIRGSRPISDLLQPAGPHEGVVVMVRLTRNLTDPSFPQLVFGEPIVLGYGQARDAGNIIEKHRQQPGLWAAPGKQSQVVYEYYWGTRLGPTPK